MLQAAAKLHTYSLPNQLLVAGSAARTSKSVTSRDPDAALCAVPGGGERAAPQQDGRRSQPNRSVAGCAGCIAGTGPAPFEEASGHVRSHVYVLRTAVPVLQG